MRYTMEQTTETRRFYTFEETNKLGEKLVVEIGRCHAEGKNSLPTLWYKHGWTKDLMTDYLVVNTYVTDTEGGCSGKYNPTHKLDEDGKRYVINFDWLFEPSDDNKDKVLNEIYNQFISADGLTATQRRINDIVDWAGNHNLVIYSKLPEGWRETGNLAYRGAKWIDNGKSFRDGRKQALLLEI